MKLNSKKPFILLVFMIARSFALMEDSFSIEPWRCGFHILGMVFPSYTIQYSVFYGLSQVTAFCFIITRVFHMIKKQVRTKPGQLDSLDEAQFWDSTF